MRTTSSFRHLHTINLPLMGKNAKIKKQNKTQAVILCFYIYNTNGKSECCVQTNRATQQGLKSQRETRLTTTACNRCEPKRQRSDLQYVQWIWSDELTKSARETKIQIWLDDMIWKKNPKTKQKQSETKRQCESCCTESVYNPPIPPPPNITVTTIQQVKWPKEWFV